VRWIGRRLVSRAVARGFVVGRRVVLIGSREELASLDSDNLLRDFGLSEVARTSLATVKAGNLSLSMTESEAKSLERAIEIARDQRADEIALAFPWADSRKLELLRDRLRDSPLPVILLPDRRIRSLAKNPAFSLQPSLSLEIQRGPLSGAEQLLKRMLDVAVAGIALLLLSPLMLVAAAAIKLDSPGPVLFRQKRKGFNSREFVIFKFRSMTVMEDGAVVRQATKSDARVTRVGRVLRQSSIDELPQLINVLIGDMSLIGPRPHAVAHDTFYGDLLSEYAFRHHVRPGITGWAQVNGYRGETREIGQMKRRIELDLWYINNWSLLLDLRILAMTCFEVARSRNAF
jgi:undecaprenyl-phosphate galactose phosphotransferase/putative colanic acid biosynthesis UDP-glucose lipid carrier transferase